MTTATRDPAVAVTRRRPGTGVFRRLCRNKWALVSMCFIGALVAVSVLAPWLPLVDPSRADPSNVLRPPSAEHWFGTDDLGRDVLSRVVFGARTSIYAALLAVVVAVGLAVPIGLVSGYLRGRTDSVLMGINDALMSIPSLILAVAIVAALGVGLTNAMLAIGIVFSTRIIRVVRGATLAVRGETFVLAAEAMGIPRWRTMIRHILPNAAGPVIIEANLAFAQAVTAEASLSFLGLGVQPPTPSWGQMIATAYPLMERSWWYALAPGVTLILLVLAVNMFGDGLKDAIGREVRGGGDG